jgi:hypothetical protein
MAAALISGQLDRQTLIGWGRRRDQTGSFAIKLVRN